MHLNAKLELVLSNLNAMVILCCVIAISQWASSANAQEIDWRYVSHSKKVHSTMTAGNREGFKLCVGHEWTAEASGFPELAQRWPVARIGPKDESALPTQSVVSSLEAAQGGICDFVGIPWHRTAHRDQMVKYVLEFSSGEISVLKR